MKLKQLCDKSGIQCFKFGHNSKDKTLPMMLKFHPQHLVILDDIVRLIYFKPSFDPRFVVMCGNEIRSITLWGNVEKTKLFIYNYMTDSYVVIDVDLLNKAFSNCRKESGSYLFDIVLFPWKSANELITKESLV